MPWGRISWLACLLLVSSTPASTAQVYNSADFVRSLYQRYLNREPSSNELTQWVWAFQKGTTVTDAQVTFLSSEDYFVRQAQPEYIRDRSVCGSAQPHPSQTEVSAWVNNLNAYRGNREKLVREFLKAAQQETSQRAPLPPASSTPAHDAQARDGQLSASAIAAGLVGR